MKGNYTKVPNKMLEILTRTKLSDYEHRYIDFVIRKTCGWRKENDYIANSQFVIATNIKKYHVWRTEKRLLWRRIVIKQGNRIAINTNYEQWRKLPKGATVTKSGIEVTQRGKKVTQNGGDKRNPTKEIKQKKNTSSFKRKLKPYFREEEMRKDRLGRWWVIPKDGGAWLEFAGKESEIEWE